MVIGCAKSLLEGTLPNLQNVDSLQWQALNMRNKLNMAPGSTQCTSTLHGTDLDERGHRTNAAQVPKERICNIALSLSVISVVGNSLLQINQFFMGFFFPSEPKNLIQLCHNMAKSAH
jgi:hypothetical protein